jgi:hypothetical protein
MNRKRTIIPFIILAVAAGCVTAPSRSPRYTKPPEIFSRAVWSRRLPSGSYRAQQPVRIGLLVTAHNLTEFSDVEEFLKDEEKNALQRTGSGQVPYHFYIDGAGSIYQGRALNCQAVPVAGHDPDGTVWIAFLDDQFTFHGEPEIREKIIHLLTYLCFIYDIPFDSIVVECRKEASPDLLCKSLEGPYIPTRVKLALEETMKALENNPTAYLHVRTQQLRTNPSAD